MNKVWRLIMNENIKLYRRLSTWIMMGAGLLLFLVLTLSYEPWSEFSSGDYPQLIVSFRFLIAIFAITVAGGIVASEYSEGTIKLLLIRSRSRWKILLAKWLTVQMFTIILIELIGLIGFLISMLSNIPSYGIETDSGKWFSVPELLVVSYYEIMVFSTMAFMVATLFRIQSAAFGVTIVAYYVGSFLASMNTIQATWFQFTIFANSNVTEGYMHGGELHMFGVYKPFIASGSVLLVHLILFLIVSFWVFQKRDVTA
ncbi:ABC-2 type transport system permease protein [Croceifilum oryzae]|uniref:ABC-2 type transport system permease protein n=1 Tax=Croceifilum oryzae TaxID=1553429 RepID=A0AAJ1TEA1_9BACL|nr:ABC transporter permease subunit [Croceifilum oryzae]MDQ0417258.1 ABC-2 type transport system permease protein [Croceifilum oryzae]